MELTATMATTMTMLLSGSDSQEERVSPPLISTGSGVSPPLISSAASIHPTGSETAGGAPVGGAPVGGGFEGVGRGKGGEEERGGGGLRLISNLEPPSPAGLLSAAVVQAASAAAIAEESAASLNGKRDTSLMMEAIFEGVGSEDAGERRGFAWASSVTCNQGPCPRPVGAFQIGPDTVTNFCSL